MAKDASEKFGGESARPFHYFRVLRSRGVDAWLLVHDRTRNELQKLMPEDYDRMFFVPDTWFHKFISRRGKRLPGQIRFMLCEMPSIMLTQFIQRRMARTLVRQLNIDLVHQPIPISPKAPSMIFDVGAPVIIGPMNGDMSYPPAFHDRNARFEKQVYGLARAVGNLMNRVIPGKLRADTLIVSNGRTARGLPKGSRGKVVELTANAVDLQNWQPHSREKPPTEPVRFVYLGRLVEFKCLDLLLDAFAQVVKKCDATLEIIGKGPELTNLQQQARHLGIADRVTFPGFLSPAKSAERLDESDVFVFPSLRECGGAVIAEAMAMGLPIVTSNWGGPADYASNDCGMLIDPVSKPGFIHDLADSMIKLANDPELRRKLGAASRDRALKLFNWESRVDCLMEIYKETLERHSTAPSPSGRGLG